MTDKARGFNKLKGKTIKTVRVMGDAATVTCEDGTKFVITTGPEGLPELALMNERKTARVPERTPLERTKATKKPVQTLPEQVEDAKKAVKKRAKEGKDPVQLEGSWPYPKGKKP